MKTCRTCGKSFNKRPGNSWKRFATQTSCSVLCSRSNRPKPKHSHTPVYQKNYRETHISTRYAVAISSAKRRELEWTISLAQYTVLMCMACYYCGNSLSKQGTGLDRVDNSKGYIAVNVLPCCKTCNVWRSDKFTPEEMRVAMQAIKSFRESEVLIHG